MQGLGCNWIAFLLSHHLQDHFEDVSLQQTLQQDQGTWHCHNHLYVGKWAKEDDLTEMGNLCHLLSPSYGPFCGLSHLKTPGGRKVSFRVDGPATLLAAVKAARRKRRVSLAKVAMCLGRCFVFALFRSWVCVAGLWDHSGLIATVIQGNSLFISGAQSGHFPEPCCIVFVGMQFYVHCLGRLVCWFFR